MAKAPAEWDDGPFMDDMRVLPPSLAAKKKKRKGVRGNDGLLDDVAPSLAATAQVQADLLATASDLYRRIEADPHGLPEDEAYWTSLPAHLRTFIRNALPLGQLGAGANTNEALPRHASTQAMMAVAQQLAQAAHASQNMLPDMYRTKDKFLPHFPGMTMPVDEDGDLVFVNELDDDDDGDLDPAYASEENANERTDDVTDTEKKKKSKKKKKKTPVAADERLPTASPPAAPLRQRSMPPVPMSVPHPPLPSSRATGKLPMMFHSATRAGSGARPPLPRRTKSSLSVGSGHTPMFPMHMAGAAPPGNGSVLTIRNGDEREKVREFWRTLSRRDRQNMVRAEEQEVLRKLKEFQRHACACSVCLRKRAMVGAKLEELYALYFDALEEQAGEFADGGSSASQGPGPFPGSIALDSHGGVVGANLLLSRPRERRKRNVNVYPPSTPTSERRELPDVDEIYDDDEYDDEYDDEFDDEALDDDYTDEYERPERRRRADSHCQGGDCYCINSSLTVKGILTLADELGGNEAHKLILMMEQLSERDAPDDTSCDVADDESNPSEQELSPDEQREQGWRMFQIFAARTLEQRVLQAYRERLAQDRQLQLLRELEEEESNEKAKEAKRAKENQRKKDKKRQVRQQKEEERLRREQEKAAEEAAAREADLKRKEELRRKEAQKREAERRELEKREAERKEMERRGAERREAERKEAEKREAQRKEAQRREMEKEAARKEAEKREAERKEAARRETARKEAERKEAERKEAERRAAEKEERRRRQQERRQRGKKAEAEAAPAAPQPSQLPTVPAQPAQPAPPSSMAPSVLAPLSTGAEAEPAGPRADLLFPEPLTRAPFALRSAESDPWDAPVPPPLPPQSTSRSLPPCDTATASKSGSPSLHAPFFDHVASTTTALGRLQLGHPSPPHAAPARDFGLGPLVAPAASSPARAVPPPIGPIERPRRTRTGSSDVAAEGVLGSAALGDDELIEPRGRRAAMTAPLSGGSAFGAPGSSALPQPAATSFYSPWSAPGYGSLGLGSLSVSSPAAPPLGGMNIPAAPMGRASGSALDPGYASPWSSSWDRARHAFEQPVDMFASDAGADLGALGGVPGAAASVRSPPGLGPRARPTPTFPYHGGPAPPFPTGP